MMYLNTIYEFLMNVSLFLETISYRTLILFLGIFNVIAFGTYFSIFGKKKLKDVEDENKTTAFFVWLLVIMMIFIDWYLLTGMSKVITYETSFDAYTIFTKGYWTKSWKNPYYDLMNVHAFYLSLFAILGNASPIAILSDFPFSIAIGIFTALQLRVISNRLYNTEKDSFLILFFALAAVPVISLTSWSLVAPLGLSLLGIHFVLYEQNSIRWVIFVLLYVSALLYHGSSTLVILLLIIYLITIRNNKRTTTIISIVLVITVILILLRFFYTTAYLGAGTYWTELINFLYYGLQVASREPHWSSPQIPRITAFSFTVLPALATAPLFSYMFFKIFRKGFKTIESNYLVHLFAGVIMLITGLIASSFSNSLSRELGYPGYIVIAIAAAYSLKHRCDKRTKYIFIIIVTVTYFLSLMTPTKNPWLYIGANPIESYIPATYESFLISETLASYYGSGYIYIKSKYLVPIQFSGFIRNIIIPIIPSESVDLVFNCGLVYVWWS